MNRVENINSFFNELRLNTGAIWLENDTINFSVPEKFQNQETKNFVLNNKIQITSILTENQIFSKEKFLNSPILKDSRASFYPLSPAQERLWFIEQFEEGTNAYHVPAVFELSHTAEIEGIKYAINQILSRHEILRSTIERGDDQHGIQVVHEHPLFIEEIQLSDKEDYQALIKDDINRPFDLSSDFPIRVKFYTLQSKREKDQPLNRTLLLINTHHIASDGWSAGIFQRELHAFYEAYRNNDTTFSLPALEIQYKDYALWQKTYLTGEVLTNQLNYWKNKLSGYQTLELPTDYARSSQVDYAGSAHGFTLNKNLSDSLRGLAQHCGVTLHTVLLSGINILLSKYTGQEDIIVGSPIANRHHRQTEGLIGFFVNTQANRTLLSKSQSYEELIQQVHQDQIAAQLHQDLPFEKFVDELKVERDTSRHPVFQVMFDVQSFKQDSRTNEAQGNLFKPFQESINYKIEKFDLSISISDTPGELRGLISYATRLFHDDTIGRLVNHFKCLLEQLIQSPRKPYSQFSLLLPEEYNKIVYQWNATDKDYPSDKTLHQLFQEQVQRTPDSIALVYEEQKLTYQELHEKSNQLARYIRDEYENRTKQNLTPDTLIALCLDRNLEMVIGILAVLKAGGAYVPIDPSYPQERIDYLLADTRATLVITQRACSENFNVQLPKDKVVYSELTEKLYNEVDTANLPAHCSPVNLAYVIYTSGTTGKPKGVMVEHRSVINLLKNQINCFDLQKDDRAIQFASYVFDASVSEIFTVLTVGAQLSIVPNTVKQDAHMVSGYLESHQINIATLPPALLGAVLYKKFPALRTLIVAGEPCSAELMAKWSKGRRLINAYGPTENTVCATMHHYAEGDSNTNIGRALNNVSLYVLDNTLAPVPIGVTGELYIGGASIARGYLNNKELTAERFITNPFATETDKAKGLTRLYKTGDLVRWLSDGNLEYVGRNDDQVKIRGYRIELGEIENALAQIAGIEQSCVLAKERKTESGSTKYLVGYYVLDTAKILTQEVIQEKLSTVLPEYMVPTAFVAMDSFPLTINGKLDKRALPDPDVNSGEEGYVAPTTDLEIRLCDIYAEVLGLSGDQIGTHQNFFKIGGNSILTMQLKNKLNQLPEFKHTGVADLFKYNTIHKLIESAQRENETVYKLQPVTRNNNHEVAIIGVSGAFSGANNIDELWQLIANQKEGIHFFSKDECKQLQVDEALLANANYVPVAGKVADIEQFDPLFWGLSPNEAKLLDPQIRKFIEHCWFVLESSGYAQQRKNHNIGVFAGSGDSYYLQKHILNGEGAQKINRWEASISNNKDALATKTAFFLDLSGPANSINTACSTGLVSVVEACYKLQLGICDMALAGGVSLSMPDQIGYIYQEGMIVSKDGHCRTFDKDASGTTGGSGVGVVLLKRLEDAIKDEDSILGVIKGYATNNDGARKTGYTAPSVIGQSECIINAQKMAGITPDQIDYIECHGTATHLGDPIEVQALREAFEYNQSKKNNTNHKTILGAVKANIGHTDSAAGTAGLIKVCAMLRHNVIPGQVNFSEPNPEMQLERTNFEILKENRVWLPSVNKQRLAGVSSFGIGGTNAHVIIGDYTPARKNQVNVEEAKEGATRFVIPLSAKSRQSLERNKQALIDYLNETITNHHSISIRDLAHTLQERRDHFSHRSACCAASVGELISELRLNTLYGQASTEVDNKIAFMFPGQGVQYTQMAKALYDKEPFFKTTIDKCIALANQHLDIDLYTVMYPQEETSEHDINEIRWSQVSLFIIEYSLAKYLQYLGVKADVYIGHSFGEYVAATLSGVFKLEDAIKVVIARGRVMQSMDKGGMLAINAKEETLKLLIEEYNCEIGIINSPEDIVASGNYNDIKNLHTALEKQDISAVRISGSVAGHSKLMDNAVEKFRDAFKGIKLNKPSKHFISNLTGEIAKEEVTTPDYWCKQLRNTVQFSKGIDSVSKQFNHQVSFVEVGPGKGLSYFVNKHKIINNHTFIQTLQLLPSLKDRKATEGYQNVGCREDIQARLWLSGILKRPNEITLFKTAKPLVSLPAYEFNHQRCWIDKGQNQSNKKFNAIDSIFYERSWERSKVNLAPIDFDGLKRKNILVLINDKNIEQSGSGELLKLFNSYCDNVGYAINQGANSIKYNFNFDFADKTHVSTILNEKAGFKPIDVVIYISPSIDLNNPAIDILAIRRIFDWTKETRNKIAKFVSISVDNYEVLGSEPLQEKPSIVYGATKAIPVEYFASTTKSLHIDLSLKDANYKIGTLSLLQNHDEKKDLIVVRGKYQWFPVYQSLELPDSLLATYNENNGSVFLITGGLGDIGYSYACKIIQNDRKCTVIIVGRTTEAHLRENNKNKLANLRNSKHKIIYASIDISNTDASSKLEGLLRNNGIDSIEVVLHTAGIYPKSAIHEKTQEDLEQVISPKISGVENLIKLGTSIQIESLICCSSLSSIIPSIGNMEYTAANMYLDEISYRSHTNIKYILAVNLNQVSDSEAVVKLIENDPTKSVSSLNSIKSAELSNVFEKLRKAKGGRNICLSRYDIKGEYELARSLNSGNEKPKNEKAIKVLEDSYAETEYQLAQIVGGVLGVDEISIHDDFFKLGGNSMLAIQVSHRINKALGLDVKVADIFKHKTISQILYQCLGQTQITIPSIKGNSAALSFTQQRLWFIEQYEGGTNAYHVPTVFELNANTNITGIKYAINQIISRHEILRITIEPGDDQQGVQVVHNQSLSIEEVQVSDVADCQAHLKGDIDRPFDLNSEYPIRVKFYNIQSASKTNQTSNRIVMLINMHHIASDGWSVDIFLRELLVYYEAYRNNDKTFNLPPLEIQYKDYAIWQRVHLTGDVLKDQLSYWKNKLSGYQILQLPTDFTRPATINYGGADHMFLLNRDISNKLRGLAKRHGLTLNSVLLGSINILLSKYTGQEDIVTGSVIANRLLPQTEGVIGFFANTQANRTLLKKSQSFEDLIQQIHQERIEIQLHQDLPFEKLVEELNVERDNSRHPVFQVMFGVQSFGNSSEVINEQGSLFKPFPGLASGVAKFDLSIFMDDSKQEIVGQMSYATSLFHKDTIARLVDHYKHLLEQLTRSPQKAYSEFTLLDEASYNQIVYQWNDTAKDYPNKTIDEVFQEQVEKTPDNIALVYGGQKLTYQELNQKSNQLARHLRDQYKKRTNQDLAAGTLIALCLDRSLEMVIGTLAIVKAGGAYVPIDPSYPQERIDYLLADTKATLVLGQRACSENYGIQLPKDKVVYVELTEKLYTETDTTNLPSHGTASDLAYVIYTSGTTGKPRGVMIEQKSVLSLVYNDYVQVQADDVFAFLSSPVFDASTFEIWTPLLKGNSLIIPGDLKNLISDTRAFDAFITNNNVTILWLTKTLFESLYHLDHTLFKTLNYLIIGGEALDKITVNNLVRSHVKPKHFLNGYGPTESTTFTCTYNLRDQVGSTNVPIGTPISNRSVYVLDPNFNPVPLGAIGELYIGGAGLARGYLNNKELTAERFITNPFATETDKAKGLTRLYKTGDLVRWLSDGNLEYVGRNDDQVKIRGYRIELGEIEHALAQVPGIKQSCVLVKERETESGSTKYLVGYYVLDTAKILTQEVIQEKLSTVLPEYMVPTAFVAMDSFPLTINGKLDKRALPDPDFQTSGQHYVAPTNETEIALCSLWQEVLGLKKVGITDDFFRIGGNSILAIQVSHKMSRALGCDVKVSDVFRYKSIDVLFKNISIPKVVEGVEWKF
jgi:amino acid adenylation domain-containing protein